MHKQTATLRESEYEGLVENASANPRHEAYKKHSLA